MKRASRVCDKKKQGKNAIVGGGELLKGKTSRRMNHSKLKAHKYLCFLLLIFYYNTTALDTVCVCLCVCAFRIVFRRYRFHLDGFE